MLKWSQACLIKAGQPGWSVLPFQLRCEIDTQGPGVDQSALHDGRNFHHPVLMNPRNGTVREMGLVWTKTTGVLGEFGSYWGILLRHDPQNRYWGILLNSKILIGECPGLIGDYWGLMGYWGMCAKSLLGNVKKRGKRGHVGARNCYWGMSTTPPRQTRNRYRGNSGPAQVQGIAIC